MCILLAITGAICIQDPDMALEPQGVPLYQGQPAYINCTVRESLLLIWRSSEYIGAEDFPVRASNSPMTTPMGAVISVLEAREGMITSRLEFNVTIHARNSSVTCVNFDQDREDSIFITSRGIDGYTCTRHFTYY